MLTSHIWVESFEAENDLSAKQFYAVEGTATNGGKVDVCDAAADRAIGILINKPKAGEMAEVGIMGIFEAVSDGSGTAIAAWDYVGTNASGKLVKKATADYGVLGQALDASSADGTRIRVMIAPINWFRTAGG